MAHAMECAATVSRKCCDRARAFALGIPSLTVGLGVCQQLAQRGDHVRILPERPRRACILWGELHTTASEVVSA